VEFYQKFWNILKSDLMAMFAQLQRVSNWILEWLLFFQKNKMQSSYSNIDQYVLSMLASIFFTKVATNRITDYPKRWLDLLRQLSY
jgi:hypothetical protein